MANRVVSMGEVTHTIDASTDVKFKTAGDAAVNIRSLDNGVLTVDLIAPGTSDVERWEWEESKVVSLLVDGNLIPQTGDAVDFLETV